MGISKQESSLATFFSGGPGGYKPSLPHQNLNAKILNVVAVAAHQSNMTLESFERLMEETGCPPQCLMEAILKARRTNLLRVAFKKYEKTELFQEMIAWDNYKVFSIAADEKQWNFFRILIKQGSEQVLQALHSDGLFLLTIAEKGKIKLLEEFLHLFSKEKVFLERIKSMVRKAATHGNLQIVQRLWSYLPEAEKVYGLDYLHPENLSVTKEFDSEFPYFSNEKGFSTYFRSVVHNGYARTVQWLLQQASEEQRGRVILHSNALATAAEKGFLGTVHFLMRILLSEASLKSLREPRVKMANRIISSGYGRLLVEKSKGSLKELWVECQRAFKTATLNGHYPVVHALMDYFIRYFYLHRHLRQMILDFGKEFDFFPTLAEKNEWLLMEKWFCNFSTESSEKAELLDSLWPVLIRAAKRGDGQKITKLVAWIQQFNAQSVEALFAKNNYEIFFSAAANGHLLVMQDLYALSEFKEEMIAGQGNYPAFYLAQTAGHTPIVKWLTQFASIEKMLAGNGDYLGYAEASKKGQVDNMQYFASLLPAEEQHMLQANRYAPLRFAAAENQWLAFEYCFLRLKQLAPDTIPEMIAAEEYQLFIEVLKHQKWSLIESFIQELTPEKVLEMLSADNFHPLRLAAKKDQWDLVKVWLSLFASEKIPQILAANSYQIFDCALSESQWAMLDFFREKLTLEETIAAFMACQEDLPYFNKYGSLFYIAVEQRDLIGIDYMLDIAAMIPSFLPGMIHNHLGFNAFPEIVAQKNVSLIARLFLFPEAFGCVEKEYHKEKACQHCIFSFADQKIRELRERKAKIADDSLGVFDIECTKEGQLYYYILRCLIRRDSIALEEDILFLLSVPAVRALACSKSQGLLDVASQLENTFAARQLMLIPEVARAVAENKFYLNARLAKIFEENEPSLKALSSTEKERLDKYLARCSSNFTAYSFFKVGARAEDYILESSARPAQ